ncbi:delta-aminolevulinic acid dehydratase [Desulfuribacillus stibiiarsenatis]|uniref:Delta-aminolevulinic acid dehydratase n=1 Tax=Desulfuribacillus stibiiarsenatis TaxID=1390249 RepID=A0A1E5L253_9FIRM|nr:porphobilinogen synthase [Desulfuribacillus stibiiarsenatis]OEH84200.1 delta-aminolevulinic acid dehydratase [Desulfuribacillus stibiiarsenatis]
MEPFQRHRRLRNTANLRSLVRETIVTVDDLMYPIFLVHGEKQKNEVPSMPGVFHLSIDMLEQEIQELESLAIKSVILFGLPKTKDELSSEAYAEDGIVQQGIRKFKELSPEIVVATDVCLCQYNPLGHCGIVENSYVTNDKTLELLAKVAVSHAKAGADIVAPSDMMDGRIYALRQALNENGFENTPIMSYAVKYASAFYGPFRDAADSKPQFGDRKTYQMDPANLREALREAASDVAEGADFLMVKPALAYLDIIRELKMNFDLPIAAYNVSGEYSMIKAAAQNGWIDEQAVVLEMLLGMKRAGSDIILTYFAKDVARWLKG